MADKILATITIEYPMGSTPESYGGETSIQKQVDLEHEYLEEHGSYLFEVMSLQECKTTINSVVRIEGE